MDTITFKEYHEKQQALMESNDDIKLFKEYKSEEVKGLYYLTEDENAQVDKYVQIFETELKGDIALIDEGFLSSVVGGVAGFLVGPTIGRVIAKALGVEKGILYDMFTSKLVNIALGSAIAKSVTTKKR